MRRLIVNADDFGFTSGVNRAIVEAHSRGVVTSATLMANGPAFAEAAQLAKTVPALSVGCHVVLIDGQPIGGTNQLSTLTNGNPAAPLLRPGLKTFTPLAIASRLTLKETQAT